MRRIIRTEIGTLRGRDCLVVEGIEHLESSMIIKASVETGIVEGFRRPKGISGEEIGLMLKFNGLSEFRTEDIETWQDEDGCETALMGSCFEELVESTWKELFYIEGVNEVRHYQLLTYDEVIEVMCKNYELDFYQIN